MKAAASGALSLGGSREAAVLFGLLFFLPFAVSFDPYVLSVLTAGQIAAVAALGWNLLAGGCGQVSFGHAGFFGIGAYVSALLSANASLPPPAAMAAAGAAGAAAGFLAGIPALRLRGAYFAMAMLVFAEGAKLLCRNLVPLAAGAAELYGVLPFPAVHLFGTVIDFRASRAAAYWLAQALLSFALLCVLAFGRCGAGLKMAAVAEDEEAAEAMGIPVFRTKVTALSASAFLSSLAGAFFAHDAGSLSPDVAFDGAWSLLPVVASIAGGMRTAVGPAAGALALAGVDEFVFKRLLPGGHRLFFGLLVAVVMIWLPSGLLGRRVRGGTPPP